MPEGEKHGGATSKGWAESAPMVGIGLTGLPNIGGGQWPPWPPGSGTTALCTIQTLRAEILQIF